LQQHFHKSILISFATTMTTIHNGSEFRSGRGLGNARSLEGAHHVSSIARDPVTIAQQSPQAGNVE
jgi:hypothetical protein